MAHFLFLKLCWPFLEPSEDSIISSATHIIHTPLPGFPQEVGQICFCFHKNMEWRWRRGRCFHDSSLSNTLKDESAPKPDWKPPWTQRLWNHPKWWILHIWDLSGFASCWHVAALQGIFSTLNTFWIVDFFCLTESLKCLRWDQPILKLFPVLLSSCEKSCRKKCPPRCPCQNGGICKGKGVCACPPGWTVRLQVHLSAFREIHEGSDDVLRSAGSGLYRTVSRGPVRGRLRQRVSLPQPG